MVVLIEHQIKHYQQVSLRHDSALPLDTMGSYDDVIHSKNNKTQKE